MHKNKGLTLIEMLYIIIFLAIILTICHPFITKYLEYQQELKIEKIEENYKEAENTVFINFKKHVESIHPDLENFNFYCKKPVKDNQENVECIANFYLNHEKKKLSAQCYIYGNYCISS